MTFIVTARYNPFVAPSTDPRTTASARAQGQDAPTQNRSERRHARRAERLAKLPRPNRPGEAWDTWAEELMAVLHARSFEHIRPPLTRPQYLYLCGCTESQVDHYRDALQALELAVHLGFNRTILRRLPYTSLARSMRYARHPNTFTRHLIKALNLPRPAPDSAPDHPLEGRRRVHGKRT